MAKIIARARPTFSIVIASAEGVAERWTAQYENYNNGEKHEITRKLQATNNPTAKEVDEIIGNRSWTSPHCCSCGEYKDKAVSFSAEENAVVCQECITAALAEIKEVSYD